MTSKMSSALDYDAEFNVLASVSQNIIHDMKTMYPAWENVSAKAIKLSSQLKATHSSMNSFIDALQAAADSANNLKGSTRDIGACLTRVCIRQRSIGNSMRDLADGLTDQLVISIQNKFSFWKQRALDMDRQASKFSRKVRSKKGGADIVLVNEQRRICHSLLLEQRNQFIFFISALIPVLNAQLNVMDESNNLREASDNLNSSIRDVDSVKLIDTMLDDIHKGSDHSWQSCLASIANRNSSIDDVSIRASSPTLSTFTWPSSLDYSADGDTTLRPNTISIHEQSKRYSINPQTFSPPSTSSQSSLAHSKPPLPRRNVSSSISISSAGSDLNIISSDQIPIPQRNGNLLSNSTTDLTHENTTHRPRPFSFACDDTSLLSHRPFMRPEPSKMSVQQTNTFINQTLEQIDRLGFELNSYCQFKRPSSTTQQTVRLRSGSCKPPPPPERRNSTITAATPTAPSVAEIRAAVASTNTEYRSFIPEKYPDSEYCSSRLL